MVLPSPIPGRLGIIPGGDHWFPSIPILSTLGIISHWSLPALATQEHRLTKLQCPLSQPGLDARIGSRAGDGGRDTDGHHEQEAEPRSPSRLVLGPGGWSRGHVWATRSWCRDPFPEQQHSQGLYRGQGAPGDISTPGDTTVLWPLKAQPCPTHDSKGKPDPRVPHSRPSWERGNTGSPSTACQPPTLGYTRARDTSWGSPQGHRARVWGHTETQLGQGHKELQPWPVWEQWRSGGHNELILGRGVCTRANRAQPICTREQKLFPLWEGLWEPRVGLPKFQWGSGCSGCGGSPQGSDGKVETE